LEGRLRERDLPSSRRGVEKYPRENELAPLGRERFAFKGSGLPEKALGGNKKDTGDFRSCQTQEPSDNTETFDSTHRTGGEDEQSRTLSRGIIVRAHIIAIHHKKKKSEPIGGENKEPRTTSRVMGESNCSLGGGINAPCSKRKKKKRKLTQKEWG